jgi:hypothetical protein
VHRSPEAVLTVVGALGTVFAIMTSLLVRRQERRGHAGVERVRPVREPKVRVVKEPKVRVVKEPRAVVRSEPQPEPLAEPANVLSEPDPRHPSLVLNLDAFTEFRAR